jgi:hypothetical protein
MGKKKLVEPGSHGIESVLAALQDFGEGVLALVENVLDFKNKAASLATKPLHSILGVLLQPNAGLFTRERSEEQSDADPDSKTQQEANSSAAIVRHLCLLN